MIFGKSKNFKQEYCCTIIKIDKVEQISNSDFLVIVNINGLPIVVRKDQVKEGDIVFYAANETRLANKFLYTDIKKVILKESMLCAFDRSILTTLNLLPFLSI